MNVTLPKKEKTDIKAVIIYTISIISCIIAAIVVAISQYLGTDELERILSVGGSNMTQEDIDEQILISGFDNIFNNQLEQYNLNIDINKKDEEKESRDIFRRFQICCLFSASEFFRAFYLYTYSDGVFAHNEPV